MTQLICAYATTRIPLSNNGAEFRNAVSAEICNQYITQAFIVAYYPPSNGLVERANRNILNALCPVDNSLFENISMFTLIIQSVSQQGKTPHDILYGVDKRLPHDWFSSPQKPFPDIHNYADQQLLVFSGIYNKVREELQASRVEMMAKQHTKSNTSKHQGTG